MRLALAVFTAGTLVACDTGFISMGKDDPAPAPMDPMLTCLEQDCPAPPKEPAMCEQGSMGSYQCLPTQDSMASCAWQSVCYPVACAPAECGDEPPGRMCSAGFLLPFECRYDMLDGCAWRQPTCP